MIPQAQQLDPSDRCALSAGSALQDWPAEIPSWVGEPYALCAAPEVLWVDMTRLRLESRDREEFRLKLDQMSAGAVLDYGDSFPRMPPYMEEAS